MARGRMLSFSISESHQVASLPDHLARLIFTWLLPHADAMGRYSAHPMVIAGKVLTLLAIESECIIRALVAMHAAGLIQLYEAKGQPYLVFLGWERHQTIRHDREKAKYPEPTIVFPTIFEAYLPEDMRTSAGSTPGELPSAGSLSLKEVKAQVEVKVKAEGIGSRRAEPDYEELVKIYNLHRGALPEVYKLNQKRCDGLMDLINEHGASEAVGLLEYATKFAAHDPFWVEKGFNLDNLLSSPGRILEKAEKFRATLSDMNKPNQYKELGL